MAFLRMLPHDFTPRPAAPEPPDAAEIEAALRSSRTPDTLPLDAPLPRARPQVLEAASERALSPAPSLEVRFEPTPDSLQSPTHAVDVELRCEAEGATIRYALGADVDESDTVYISGEPIALSKSAQVSARAWLGDAAGPLASALYRVEAKKPQWEQREPAEQSDPTPHHDTLDLHLGDGWRAAAASARGKLHAHRALWREDSFAVAQANSQSGNWAILIAADGAGSAALSRVGSRLACESVAAMLRESLSDVELGADIEALKARGLPSLREKLVEAARRALQVLGDEAQARQKPLSEFATTLLILVRCAWNGQHICGALQVGDGAIALLNGDGLLTILGRADHGEHSSETRFLTTPGIAGDLENRVLFSIRSGLRAVAVMTDGVADDFFPEAQKLPAMLAQVLGRVQSSERASRELLEWLGYEKRGSSDDRTLIVSWRAEPGAEPGEAASTCSGEGGVADEPSHGEA